MRYSGFIVCLVLLVALAIAVAFGATMPFDEGIRSATHHYSSERLTALAHLLSLIGSNGVWIPVAIIFIALLWFSTRRKQAVAMVTVLGGAALLENGLKFGFHRARPQPYFGTLPATYSFPSGHALFALCFYCLLAAIITKDIGSAGARVVVWSVALLLALGIGLSRIYLGVHYPSDVVAGYLAGGAWLALLRARDLLRFE